MLHLGVDPLFSEECTAAGVNPDPTMDLASVATEVSRAKALALFRCAPLLGPHDECYVPTGPKPGHAPTVLYLRRTRGDGDEGDAGDIQEWAESQAMARAMYPLDQRQHILHPARVWKQGEAWVCAITKQPHAAPQPPHLHWAGGNTLALACNSAIHVALVVTHTTHGRVGPPPAWERAFRALSHMGEDTVPVYFVWGDGDVHCAVGGCADWEVGHEEGVVDALDAWARALVCAAVHAACRLVSAAGVDADAEHTMHLLRALEFTTAEELLHALFPDATDPVHSLWAAAREVVQKHEQNTGAWKVTHPGLLSY